MFDNSIFHYDDDDQSINHSFSHLYIGGNNSRQKNRNYTNSKYKQSWEYRLKVYNWTIIPIIAHIAVFVLLLLIGLSYDGVVPTKSYVYFCMLILAYIFLTFPFTFWLQRHLESRGWHRQDRLYNVANGLSTSYAGNPLTESEADTILTSSLSDDFAPSTMFIYPSSIFERIYKHIVFNQSLRGGLDDSYISPSAAFITLHVWIAVMLVLGWAYLNDKHTLNVRELPLMWFLPTYILLGLGIVFHFVLPTGGFSQFWFVLPSFTFILTAIFVHSNVMALGKLAIWSIVIPQLLFPLALLVFAIVLWLYAGFFFGVIMMTITALFTTWFFLMAGYVNHWLRPGDAFLHISKLPLTVAMIPALLIVLCFSVMIFVKTAQ